MSSSIFNIEEFRHEYLATLDEELHNIEDLVLKLEKLEGKEFQESLYTIFRKVHSFKGSAGSYELFMLGTIFHRFEDFLNTKLNKERDANLIDQSLKYLDILTACVQEYKKENPEVEKYTSIMEELVLNSNVERNFEAKLLLLDATKSMTKIFEKLAKEHNIELVILSNGVTALNRILHERFDIIVSSKNIASVDGESLLKAVKVMKCVNQDSTLVLISSDDKDKSDSDEYHFFPKDEKLIQNLDEFLHEKILLKIANENAERDFPFNNVLITEDDPMIQKILRRIFHDLEHTKLTLTSDLASSCAVIQVEKPDLVILDYYLDDCVGTQILEKIYAKNGKLETPILFMTSSPEKLNLEEAKEWGNVRGIVEKPIKAKMLLDEILKVALS